MRAIGDEPDGVAGAEVDLLAERPDPRVQARVRLQRPPRFLGDLLVVVDDVVLVREESIKAGMRLLYRHAGLIVEPSAALGVAAVLEDRERFGGRRIATVICGSNVTTSDFERWVLTPATIAD